MGRSMTSQTETYQQTSERERRIEENLKRFNLKVWEERQFRTLCEFLDVFIWQRQIVDLRGKA